MYSRVATFVSVVSGALLGALAALISVTPSRPAPDAKATQESAISRTAAQTAKPDGAVAPAASAPAAAPTPSAPKPPDAEKLSEMSLSCSRGDPADCLRAASVW